MPHTNDQQRVLRTTKTTIYNMVDQLLHEAKFLDNTIVSLPSVPNRERFDIHSCNQDVRRQRDAMLGAVRELSWALNPTELREMEIKYQSIYRSLS